ncbi:conserved hypothetical protein (plasmid) [Nitrobacter hamburgensis X14]|uniref:Putative DNA-binding domain-containing protein n=1 Tax=Nitrobacter hamburgensis (strain DSM 10229 / NCIMB 13809 / X14) TaxID=323097 RepID=Q1QEZ1_NITHX|nr:putative DNA-binding domain-containing protein [Nitrobacter hamburgensis]ABE65206.1 conserved hypothetical protein [Nitrobacter hamburgensis X14]
MALSVDRQKEFAAALLDPEQPAPTGVVGPDGDPCPKRFAVYRNNVVVGLIEILRAVYPAVRRLVGDEFFDAMAGVHVRIEPPRSPILVEYGGRFPAFIETFRLASSLPYLADVARIEWAWAEAYHARDACALTASSFSEVPIDQYPSLRLQLHPSVRVVRSAMPALTIWNMNVRDSDSGEVVFDGEGETALVARPDAVVQVRSLSPGAPDFIDAIGARHTVAKAAELAGECDGRFDLSSTIAGLIEAGALCAYQTHSGVRFEAKGVVR